MHSLKVAEENRKLTPQEFKPFLAYARHLGFKTNHKVGTHTREHIMRHVVRTYCSNSIFWCDMPKLVEKVCCGDKISACLCFTSRGQNNPSFPCGNLCSALAKSACYNLQMNQSSALCVPACPLVCHCVDLSGY